MNSDFNIKILVAPLDWGLGHATRCVPLIKHLLDIGCTVILATDGPQKNLLQLEFPELIIEHLEGYNITYAKKKHWFSFKIISQLPKILSAIKKEHQSIKTIVTKHNINAIISDNRYGLWQAKIPVAFITHQLNIITTISWTESFIRSLHYRYINRFTECWVPDIAENVNLSGRLSHPKNLPAIPVKYIGGISRFEEEETTVEYEAIIIISGPEPQRSTFELQILKDVRDYKGKLLLVRGLPAEINPINSINNTTIVNHMPAKELSTAVQKSKIVISRSGYTTVMDILKLRKKSVLVPTPGQTEQEYLAKHLHEQNWCLHVNQSAFNLDDAIKMSAQFSYQLPTLNMNAYKPVLTDFVEQLNRTSKI